MSDNGYSDLDLEVIERLTRIETKIDEAKLSELTHRVAEHDRFISRAKGALTIVGSLWALLVAILAKIAWTHR